MTQNTNARTSRRRCGTLNSCRATRRTRAPWRSTHGRPECLGSYGDATVLKKFGEVPDNLDEL